MQRCATESSVIVIVVDWIDCQQVGMDMGTGWIDCKPVGMGMGTGG